MSARTTVIKTDEVINSVNALRGDTIKILIQKSIPAGATVRSQLRQTVESEEYYVLDVVDQYVIISADISQFLEGYYVLDVEQTYNDEIKTIQKTTVNIIADVTRVYGVDNTLLITDFEKKKIIGTSYWIRNEDGTLTSILDLSNKEDIANKVISLSVDSTDIEYPSAKAVYTELLTKQSVVELVKPVFYSNFYYFTKKIKYGHLYNYYAIVNSNFIAASNAHVPINSEWSSLIAYIGGLSTGGGKLKEMGLSNWSTPNTGATDSYGLEILGSGRRNQNGSFAGATQLSYIGMNTETGIYMYTAQLLYNFESITNVGIFNKTGGVSLRLVIDTPNIILDSNHAIYQGNDGTLYPCILINTKWWLACNLIETKYRNGDDIPIETDNTTWSILSTGARCSYNNDENNSWVDLSGKVDKEVGKRLITQAESDWLQTQMGV